MNRISFLSLLSAILLTACGGSGKNEAQSEISYHGDTCMVNSTSPICNKIKTIEVAEQPFCDEFRTVGTAKAETGKFAEVCVPYDGRITSSSVRLGQTVGAGQVLCQISSPDFAETSKAYFQAVQNYNKAHADYDRKKALFDHGIIAQRELDEFYAEAENARHEKNAAEATLRSYNVNPSTLRMGQSLSITAPISGEVVATNITPGQLVKADDAPIATIADLSTMWVTALIKERYIGTVTLGGQAEVFTESEPDSIIWGKIINVGNMVDEETRSVQVTIACDNKDHKLKHGMYVSVHFMSEPRQAIVVPASAVFQGEQKNFVFVKTDKENCYVRRDVEVATSSDDNQKVCIRRGLQAGDSVIVEGGIYLAE